MKALLLAMSLSGAAVFLLHVVFLPLTGKVCSNRWKYGMLKLSLLFFLFPFPYFKRYYIDVLSLLARGIRRGFGADRISLAIQPANKLYITNTGIMFTGDEKRRLLIQAVSLTISLIFIGIQLFRCIRLNYLYKKYALKEIEGEKTRTHLEALQEKTGVRQKLCYYESDYLRIPMVLGLLRPMIILPFSKSVRLTENELDYVVLHELFHVGHKDIWIKFAALLAIAIHWFNPVVYLLYFQICCMSEIYCDEELKKRFTREELREYGRLVIKMSVSHLPEKGYHVPVSLLGSTKNITQKRINEMKKQGRSYHRILAVIVGIFICLAASTVILAYDPAVRDPCFNIELESQNEKRVWFNKDRNPNYGAALERAGQDAIQGDIGIF